MCAKAVERLAAGDPIGPSMLKKAAQTKQGMKKFGVLAEAVNGAEQAMELQRAVGGIFAAFGGRVREANTKGVFCSA